MHKYRQSQYSWRLKKKRLSSLKKESVQERTLALATTHAGTRQCRQIFARLCARLGIHRAVHQLGAPANFKTLAARTRPHGGLRRTLLAHDTGRRARAKTTPRRAGSTRRHWSLCMKVK